VLAKEVDGNRLTSMRSTLGSDDQYHKIWGPGPANADGDLSVGFSAELEYDTPYSFRFWLDAESHAQTIPEPGALILLAVGALLARRR
jgi:MYXO-CTERM domain-containing protein